ncbi:APC family permease [Acinetobacter seifertii]|uniref:APC family permease n=1 Tax=Acinetobacter seifertii TaxID=1530123 RepID=UPI0006661726|nr:APC family permease [Acinetobacter seifertii]
MNIEHSKTKPSLGRGSLFFMVIAAAAPLTTMAAFAPLGFMLGGVAMPLGYIIAGITYIFFAIGFLALVRHNPRGGAFYTYISMGLGKNIGVGSALVAYVSYALGQIGFCAAAGVFAHQALLSLHIDIPWYMCAVTMAMLSGGLAYFRVELNALVMGIIIIAEISILVIFSWTVLQQGGAEGISFTSLNPLQLFNSGIGTLLVVTFLVFIGFEQTAIYSEEAKDSKHTVSHATYAAILFLAVFYFITSWSIYIAIGANNFEKALASDPANLVFNLATQYLGSFFSSIMLILVLTSFFAGILALQNASARYLRAIAVDHMLPKVFASTNNYGMPKFAGIFQMILVILFIILSYLFKIDPYAQLVIWTNTPTIIGILILQAITSISVIRYFMNDAGETTLWQRFIAPSLATVMLLSVVYLLLHDMPLLTGMSLYINILITLPLIIAFIAGFIRSVFSKKIVRSKNLNSLKNRA